MTDPQRDPNAEARAIVSELAAVLSRLYQLDPTVVAADELTFQRLVRCVHLLGSWHQGTVHIRNGLEVLHRDDTSGNHPRD
ncbi:MAG: hypothetical protein J2P17_08915 [Mycobacterium sp.]|nr:hypothetical protein [Mycobacterium sp.]